MKKAVIKSGGKQYLVHEGETISVELIESKTKAISFEPLLVIDGDKIDVGTPQLTTFKVSAIIEQPDIKANKVVSIRYEAKKRVHKLHGHRQHLTSLRIVKVDKA